MSGMHAADKAEPNLTPILDMVFQLITFFMMVISFKSSDFDKMLVLPVIGSAAPAEETAVGEYFILNLRSGGGLFVQGKEKKDIESFVSIEATVLKERVKGVEGDAGESRL